MFFQSTAQSTFLPSGDLAGDTFFMFEDPGQFGWISKTMQG